MCNGELQAAPAISVTSPLKHAKIDSAGHISLPSLSLWNAQTSKLADVVEEAYSMVSSKHGSELASDYHVCVHASFLLVCIKCDIYIHTVPYSLSILAVNS